LNKNKIKIKVKSKIYTTLIPKVDKSLANGRVIPTIPPKKNHLVIVKINYLIFLIISIVSQPFDAE